MKRLLFILIFLGILLTQSYGITDPWSGEDIGYNGAFYSIQGRNFVRYGFLKSRLGPIDNTGDVRLGGISHYLNHPPLLSLCLGIAFKFFGTHEWVAHWVPLFFSFGSLLLIYLFGKRCWSERIARLAVGIAAFVPAFLFYGKHVEAFGSLLLFFTLLALFGYEAWLRTEKNRFLILLLFSIGLAAFSDWDGYLLTLLFPVHLLGQRQKPALSKKFWIFPLAGIVCLSLLMFYSKILFDEVPVRHFFDQLNYRQRLGSISFLDYFFRMILYLCVYFTPVILVFVLFWLRSLFRKRVPGEWGGRNGVLFLLFGMGFFRILSFHNFSWEHRYVVFMMIPFMAYTGALGIDHFYSRFLGRAKYQKWAAVGLALFFLIFSLATTGFLYRLSRDFSGYHLGEFIRRHTAFDEIVLTSAPRSYNTLYYSDRKVFFNVRSLERFSKLRLREGRRLKWLVIDTHAPLEGQLAEKVNSFPLEVAASRYQLYRLLE